MLIKYIILIKYILIKSLVKCVEGKEKVVGMSDKKKWENDVMIKMG